MIDELNIKSTFSYKVLAYTFNKTESIICVCMLWDAAFLKCIPSDKATFS